MCVGGRPPTPPAGRSSLALLASGQTRGVSVAGQFRSEFELIGDAVQAAGKHGRSEYQQNISHDRPDDRGLHHIMKPGTQGGECDDQLGGVAESRIEESANSLARAVGPAVPLPGQARRLVAGWQSLPRQNQQMALRREVF